MTKLLGQFARHPLHPLLAVGVLAAGLAISVATLTYLKAFERSFPGVDASGLVRVFDERGDGPFGEVSYLDYVDLRESAATVALGAVQRFYAASVRHQESAEVAFIEAVAGEYFPVLGARAHRGRLLGPQDDRPGADPAAVISWSWWQTAFAGREDILGHTLVLNFRPFTVVGVAAPDFLGSNADARPQVWMPLAQFRQRYTNWDRLAQDRDVPLVTVLGRLNPGATVASAQEELSRLGANLDRSYPRDEGRRIAIRPATWIDPAAREAEAATLRMMTWAALFFLLLVCANAVNVFLSVALKESRADAIRAAVGASPGRILRGALARTLVLSGSAGILGTLLAVPLVQRMGAYFARPSVWGESVQRDFPVDGPIVAVGLLLALAVGTTAAVPALRAAASRSPVRALTPGADHRSKGPGRTRRGFPLRDLMVAVQAALAVGLLVLSGLVVRTFAAGSEVGPGFDTSDLLGGLVSVSSLGIERTETRTFFADLKEELRREPWVRAVSQGDRLPLAGHPSLEVRAAGMEEGVQVLFETISHDFMETLGVPVLEGRDFGPEDEGHAGSALLNQSAAELLFPEGGAVGRSIELPGSDEAGRSLEVLGVMADTRLETLLEAPRPAVFLQFRDSVWPTTNALIVRTVGPADAQAAADLRGWLRDHAGHMTIINSVHYDDVVAGDLYAQRMNAELFTGLAGLGLALACAGIFGVVSLSVSRRRREIGIRKAVGATEARIRREVVRRAMTPVLVGGAVGLLLSLVGARMARSLLFGVAPFDPVSLAAGAGILVLAAAASAWIPSWFESRRSVRAAVG